MDINLDFDASQLADAVTKAYQTTANQPNVMQIEVDETIHSKTVEETALLSTLRMKGCEKPTDAAKVSFIEETPNNTAAAIGEVDNLPDYAVTAYTEHPETMRVIASGFKVSFLSQMGGTMKDILQTEINRGYILVNNLIDNMLLNGNATNNPLEFDNIWNNVSAVDAQGEALSEEIIDDAITTAKGNGGSPDILVTDSEGAKQLKKLAAPYRRYNDKIDIGLGHRVITYESIDGRELAVVVDEHMPVTGTGDKATHMVLPLDSSSISIKTLLPPSIFDIPASNLAYNKAIATFTVARNCAPFKSAAITNIGKME